MIAWDAPVDLYCERFAPGPFEEPWNALSNLAFVVLGLWLASRLPRYAGPQQRPAWTLEVLAGLMTLVGICSAAFHVFAVKWAELLDVGSIGLFVAFFAICFARHVLDIGWDLAWMAAPVLGGFGIILTGPFAKGAYNGSVAYFPVLGALVLMALGLLWRRRPGWLHFLAAAVVFAVALALRSQDLAWCPRWPWGTHWAWHLLDAGVLCLAVIGLAKARRV